jgi:hypothetical protein
VSTPAENIPAENLPDANPTPAVNPIKPIEAEAEESATTSGYLRRALAENDSRLNDEWGEFFAARKPRDTKHVPEKQ